LDIITQQMSNQVKFTSTQSSNIQNNMNPAAQRKQQNAEWAFDTNSRDENGVVLCIPRVFANITKKRIFACICNAGWGEIDHVDLINCGSYQKAFIHFRPNGWYCGSEPAIVLRRLQAGEQVAYTYDVNDRHPEGWFWKISISKAMNPKFRPKRVRRRQTVDLSSNMDATASAFVPQQVVNDDMLLQRKHQNQKACSPRDDPIRARQMEHKAVLAKVQDESDVLVEEEYSRRIVQDFYRTEDRKDDESDGEIEEDFSCLSEQAATYMEQQAQLKKA
jgi:hypothetical protein